MQTPFSDQQAPKVTPAHADLILCLCFTAPFLSLLLSFQHHCYAVDQSLLAVTPFNRKRATARMGLSGMSRDTIHRRELYSRSCLAENELRPMTLVRRDDSPEQGFHADLVSLCHHNHCPASLRCVRIACLQQSHCNAHPVGTLHTLYIVLSCSVNTRKSKPGLCPCL